MAEVACVYVKIKGKWTLIVRFISFSFAEWLLLHLSIWKRQCSQLERWSESSSAKCRAVFWAWPQRLTFIMNVGLRQDAFVAHRGGESPFGARIRWGDEFFVAVNASQSSIRSWHDTWNVVWEPQASTYRDSGIEGNPDLDLCLTGTRRDSCQMFHLQWHRVQ